MPFKSIAQERWAHTPQGMARLGGADKVAEWDNASRGLNLPARVGVPQAHVNHPRSRMMNQRFRNLGNPIKPLLSILPPEKP